MHDLTFFRNNLESMRERLGTRGVKVLRNAPVRDVVVAGRP